jgi:hypothetical protein
LLSAAIDYHTAVVYYINKISSQKVKYHKSNMKLTIILLSTILMTAAAEHVTSAGQVGMRAKQNISIGFKVLHEDCYILLTHAFLLILVEAAA